MGFFSLSRKKSRKAKKRRTSKKYKRKYKRKSKRKSYRRKRKSYRRKRKSYRRKYSYGSDKPTYFPDDGGNIDVSFIPKDALDEDHEVIKFMNKYFPDYYYVDDDDGMVKIATEFIDVSDIPDDALHDDFTRQQASSANRSSARNKMIKRIKGMMVDENGNKILK